DRSVGTERQFARAMLVARDAQVPRPANVDAELDGVVAHEPSHVRDELRLLLVLVQRTVAPVDAEARPEVEPTVSFDETAEQSRREAGIEVEPRDAGIPGWRRAEVEREHVHFVFEEPEAEIDGRVRADASVE